LEAFIAEAEQGRAGRLEDLELAAVDPPLLAALGARDERRTRCELTLVGDHLYLTLGPDSLEGPLHRGSVRAR
jgi:hypothetical protein